METSIWFSEADKTADIFTHNGPLQRRLTQLAKDHPDECQLYKQNEWEGMRFKFPKSWVRTNPGTSREYTEEEKQASRDRINAYRASKKNQSSLCADT